MGEPWYRPSIQQTDPFYDAGTLHKIQNLKVTANWSNISLGSALHDLEVQSKSIDNEKKGIRFNLNFSLKDKVVTMTLVDEPLVDVLGYLAQQVGFIVKIHNGEVLIVPKKE